MCHAQRKQMAELFLSISLSLSFWNKDEMKYIEVNLYKTEYMNMA